ncbi:MAG: pitrilysin family protein [Desulfovibrionaceae bacterium]|nr:pitrilysin family protein [Desulfovibrionaceae bacterium]
MVSWLIAMLLGASMVLTSNILVWSGEQTSPEDTVIRLRNGMQVLVAEDHRFPLVSCRLYVQTGAAYETEDKAGISHILEHMVFKGTQKRPLGIVSRDTEAAGGYLNAATSYDYTVYLTDMPSSQWKLGMDIVQDMAFFPKLDSTDLESEKQVILEELKRGEDRPDAFVFKETLRGLLAGSPYERPVIGFENTIRSVTADDIRMYMKRFYQPQSMLLVVVGDIRKEEILTEAERLFGNFENIYVVQKKQTIDPATLMPYGPKFEVREGPWKKTHVTLAFPVPGQRCADSVTLDLLAYMLGDDKTGRLTRKYRDELQLVDTLDVSNLTLDRLGVFLISAELSQDKLEAFQKGIFADLASLSSTSFSETEIRRAQNNIEDAWFRSCETVSGLASKKGYAQFFYGGEMEERRLLDFMRAVGNTEIQKAISMWLQRDRLYGMILAPDGKQLYPETIRTELLSLWNIPKQSEKDGSDAGKTEVVNLGRGCSVVLRPDSTIPYFSASLAFSGGNVLVPDKSMGLASLTAEVITKGTSGKNAAAVQNLLADCSADLEAVSGSKHFAFTLTGPSRSLPVLLDLLKETISAPAFSEDEVQKGIRRKIAEVISMEDQPLGMISRQLPPFLFSNFPYKAHASGDPAVLKHLSAGEVASFWKKQSSYPWVFSVCGSFDKNEILRFAERLPVPSEEKVFMPVPVWRDASVLDISFPGRKQAHMMLLYPTVGMDHPDSVAISVLREILNGQSGYLFTELRDRQGLCYTVAAFTQAAEEYGYMGFYIGTDPENMERSEKGFHQVVEEILKGKLIERDVYRAINQLKSDFWRNRQSLGSRASEGAVLILGGYSLDRNQKMLEKIQNVTLEQVVDVANRYLKKNAEYIVKVLP